MLIKQMSPIAMTTSVIAIMLRWVGGGGGGAANRRALGTSFSILPQSGLGIDR